MCVSMIEIALLIVYGLPIVLLSSLFIYAAVRMMREEERRAQIRAASMKARRYEAMRRRARGTPRRRPGSVALR